MSQAPKKWMVVLEGSQYEWIKETAEKADVSGAAVCRALISQAMEQNSTDFRRNLVSAQVKAELASLAAKRDQITQREKELRAKLPSNERVAV